MGLFRRLIGRDDRDRSRQEPPAGVAVGHDPTTATFLPDWSEYWITTTREQQAEGAVHPHLPSGPAQSSDPPQPVDSAQPSDDAQLLAPQAGDDPIGIWAPGSFITVDLTPGELTSADLGAAEVSAAPPVDVPGSDLSAAPPIDVPAAGLAALHVAATDVPAVDHSQFQPDAMDPAASDRAPIDDAAVDPTPTHYDLGVLAVEPLHEPAPDGQILAREDFPLSWGDEGSVLDQPAADFSAPPDSGSLQSLPPPMADSVVLHVPPPVASGLMHDPRTGESEYLDVPLADDPSTAGTAFWSVLEPEPAPPQLVAGRDDLVLDVRDPSDRNGQDREPGSQVVLGFGDGSEQQLAGDNPDVSAFHALAAALTSAPRHSA